MPVPTVTLTGPLASSTVSAQAVDPAVDADFTLSSATTLTIAAGATASTGTVTITAVDNAVDAPDKTVTVSGAASGGNAVEDRILTLVDDEETPSFSVAGTTVDEGEVATFVVSRSGAAGNAVSVMWATAGHTDGEHPASAADYIAVSVAQDLNFDAGEMRKTIRVQTIEDSLLEPDETFLVRLTGATGPALIAADRAQATGTIKDDDHSATTERIKRVNKAILSRVGSAMMRSQIDQLTDCLDHATSGEGAEGLSALRESLLNSAEALNRDEISLDEVLAGTRLAAKTPAGAGPTGFSGTTFCAGADWRRLSSIDDGLVALEGHLFGAHLGGNVALADNILAGLDVSRHESSIDWRDGTGAEAFGGDWRMHLNAVHPYLVWSMPNDLRLWAMPGYGSGGIRIVEETPLDQSADLTLRSFAFGGAFPLIDREEVSLHLVGDAWLGELAVEGNGSLIKEELSVTVQGVRVLAEGEWRSGLDDGSSLASSMRSGLQYDDGAGGMGLEVGLGLRWDNPTQGLSAAVSSRVLLARGDVEEWGMSADVQLAPAKGLGPSFSFLSSWGDTADKTEALWEHGLAAMPDNDDVAALSLDAEAGWGFHIAGSGVLTPFVGWTLSGRDARSLNIGGRLEIGELNLEIVGRRRESASGSSDHGLFLEVTVRW